MRSAWFDHVKKTREKESRVQKTNVTHREAMKLASQTWPTIKAKLQKKLEREKKKADRALKKTSKDAVEKLKGT